MSTNYLRSHVMKEPYLFIAGFLAVSVGCGASDASPDDAQVPDAGVDAALPACDTFADDSPWCTNVLVSPAGVFSAEEVLSIDDEGREVVSWMRRDGYNDVVA